jgi:hypothetical protein
MSNEVIVMNWFFGITMGLWLLVGIAAVIYRWKGKKIERIPKILIFQLAVMVCWIAAMNLRNKHEGIAIGLEAVGGLLVLLVTPMTWRRFVKHLRDEGFIAKRRLD